MIVRKTVILSSVLFLLTLAGCKSVASYNAGLSSPKSVKELRADIDFVQHKLEKLHPDLYHFISKTDFDAKFDSLRKSLAGPMTSNAFFLKLSPVIASIRQGHTQLHPVWPRLNSAERKTVNSSGTSPLTQFDYELFGQKLYIIRNNSKDSTLRVGTELISVDGIPTQELLDKYARTFASDGYNSTFFSRRLAKAFARYFYLDNGLKDSVRCVVAYRDSVRTLMLHRPVKQHIVTPKKSKEQLVQERRSQQEEQKKRKLQGYDAASRSYSKQLTFYQNDSTIAVLKITDFSRGNYKKFYRMSFQKLDSLHTKNLIIDLRDNPGGRLDDVRNLYAYLADTSFRFVEKSEVVSKTSLWHAGYFSQSPAWQIPIRVIGLPFVLGADAYTYFATAKINDSTYRFPLRGSHLRKTISPRFRGKVYVLINGGSFSASGLLAANLNGSRRAVLVGAETGGAYNGCVAGIMPVFKLPHSGLSLRFGLLVCKTPYTSNPDGRGIFPDKEIVPSIEDRINGTDPEMLQVLQDIGK